MGGSSGVWVWQAVTMISSAPSFPTGWKSSRQPPFDLWSNASGPTARILFSQQGISGP